MAAFSQQKEQDLAAAQEEIQNLQNTHAKLNEAFTSLTEKHSVANENIAAMQNDSALRQTEFAALQETLAKEIEQLRSLVEKDKEDMAAFAQQKEQELITADEEIQSAQEANTRLNDAFASLSEKYSQANEQIAALENNMGLREIEFTTQYKALANEVEQQRSQAEKETGDRLSQYQQKNQELQLANELLQNLTITNQQLESALAQVNEQHAQATEQISALAYDKMASATTLAAHRGSYTQEIEKLQAQMDESALVINSLTQQLDQLASVEVQNQRKGNELAHTLYMLTVLAETQDNTFRDIQNTLNTTQMANQQLQVDNAKLKERLQKFEIAQRTTREPAGVKVAANKTANSTAKPVATTKKVTSLPAVTHLLPN